MVSGTSFYGVVMTLLLPTLGLPQAEEVFIPSVCNPLMPQDIYNAWSVLKSACVCSANAQRESCYERTLPVNDFEGYFLCEIRNCQNLNLCELVVPCAQTLPPGLSIDDCATTVQDYPDLSTKSWLYDPVGDTDALGCVIDAAVDMSDVTELQYLNGLVQIWQDLISSTTQIVVGSTP